MSTPRKPAQATTAKADTNKAEETAKVAETAVTKSTDLAGAGEEKGVSNETLQKAVNGANDYVHPSGKTIDEIVAEKVAEALKDLPNSGVTIDQLKVEDGHVVGITTKNDAEVAQVAEKEVKKVKIKFIKDHSFYVNTEKFDARPNDVLMVERHIANKLVGRHIAYILG